MKRLILTALLSGIIYLPISCIEECENFFYQNNVSALRIDFGVLTPFYEKRDSVSYDSATLIVAVAEVERISERLANSGSLYATAWAEDCGTFSSELHHDLQSIEVTSDMNMDINGASYPAGTKLNDLFLAIPSQDQSFELSLALMVDLISTNRSLFADEGASIYFRLAEAPTRALRGSFLFTFTFDDRVISADSAPITITP